MGSDVHALLPLKAAIRPVNGVHDERMSIAFRRQEGGQVRMRSRCNDAPPAGAEA